MSLECERCGNRCHHSHGWRFCPDCGGKMMHEDSVSQEAKKSQKEFREYIRLRQKFES